MEKYVAELINMLGFVPASNCVPSLLKPYGIQTNQTYIYKMYAKWVDAGILRDTGITPRHVMTHGKHKIDNTIITCSCYSECGDSHE